MAEHLDLVGHTLEVGDRVAYPTQRGSSARMCVAEILEIIDYETNPSYFKPEIEEKWKVRLQPLHYTDYRSDSDYKDGERTSHAPKAVMVSRVENLVRVGPLKLDFIDLSDPNRG